MRILITAPDRDLLDSLRSFLALCGMEADVAHDGVTAIEKSRALKYDAALVDEKIPLIRAADLIKELDESGTPAILMTEDPGAGGDKVIYYPFTPEELLSSIGGAGKERP